MPTLPSHSDPNHALATRSRVLFDRLFPPPRAFAVRLWDGREWPASGPARFRLDLTHPGALGQMLRPPLEQSLGEAYIHGDFEVEGDLGTALAALATLRGRRFTFAEILLALRDVARLPRSGPARLAGRGPVRLRGRRHSRQRDRDAVRYHYDVGNAFYGLWLDRRMQYSCAYFHDGGEDLDAAQTQKLEHICRKLRLHPGQRLLDIGCGWGGLARHAAQEYGADVVGITLSDAQARYAAEQVRAAGLTRKIAIRLIDYRDLKEPGGFDRIVSVGMFEHIGRAQLPIYFSRVFDLLRPGGLFLNHGISIHPEARRVQGGEGGLLRRTLRRLFVGDGRFSQRYIFPDSQLVPVSEANLVSERSGFEVRDVESLREHYALTCRHWERRLLARRDEAVAATDAVTFRTWRLHLAAAAQLFESGAIGLHQTLLSKGDDGRCRLPLTRAHLDAPHSAPAARTG